MSRIVSQSLAALAAVILAITSIGAILAVPPAKAQITNFVPAVTELA